MDGIIEARLAALETWQRVIDIARAKEEVDRKHIDERFDDIEASLLEIKETAKWLNRAVWGAAIIYLVQFTMSGGWQIITGVK